MGESTGSSLYHENDSLEAFLDRTLLNLYLQVLATTGNRSQAARFLRIDRTSLYQRLEHARRLIQMSELRSAITVDLS
jgi:transcriptional regulator with PAS, ATPase and Fis domain